MTCLYHTSILHHVQYLKLIITQANIFFKMNCIYINVGSCQNPGSQWVNNIFIFMKVMKVNRTPINLRKLHWFSSVQAGPNINVLYYPP